MKEKHCFWVLVCLCFLEIGCQTAPEVIDMGFYDASIPPEQNCTVTVHYTARILEFDDKEVDWYDHAIKYFKRGTNYYTIHLPSGKHTFEIKAKTGPYIASFRKQGYELEAGKNYHFSVYVGIYVSENKMFLIDDETEEIIKPLF